MRLTSETEWPQRRRLNAAGKGVITARVVDHGRGSKYYNFFFFFAAQRDPNRGMLRVRAPGNRGQRPLSSVNPVTINGTDTAFARAAARPRGNSGRRVSLPRPKGCAKRTHYTF